MIRNKLKSLRHAREMNQKQFTAFLGVHQSVYNRWERQQNQPNIEQCFKLSRKLKMPIEELFEPPD